VLKLSAPRDEPGHRSPLPVWIKLPVIMAVTLSLVLVKNQLRGFVTVFPMVGVIAVYEMRHSLWTTCRQIAVLMIALIPMLIVLRLSQDRLGLGGALPLGWVVFLAVLIPMTRKQINGCVPFQLAYSGRDGEEGNRGRPAAWPAIILGEDGGLDLVSGVGDAASPTHATVFEAASELPARRFDGA